MSYIYCNIANCSQFHTYGMNSSMTFDVRLFSISNSPIYMGDPVSCASTSTSQQGSPPTRNKTRNSDSGNGVGVSGATGTAGRTIAMNLNIPWLLNLNQSRKEELCQCFNINRDQNLVDDFNCAIRKRVLLQGRLFVFDDFVSLIVPSTNIGILPRVGCHVARFNTAMILTCRCVFTPMFSDMLKRRLLQLR